MATVSVTAGTNIAAIFARAIQLDQADLSPEAARAVLKFRFPDPDLERFHQLAEKNQQGGGLTPQEDQEMKNYLCLDVLFSLLHSKARKSLKHTPAEA